MADNAETQGEPKADVPAKAVVAAPAAKVAEAAPAKVETVAAKVEAAPVKIEAAPTKVETAPAKIEVAVAKVAAAAPAKAVVTAPAKTAAVAPVATPAKRKVGRPRKVAMAPVAKAAKVAPAPRKAAIAKTKAAAKPAIKAKKTITQIPTFTQIKEKIMATKTPDFTAAITGAVAEAQEKAKAAYEKSTAAFGEYNEFAKGNVEAAVASGKILATGLKELGGSLVAESKVAFETLTSDVKEFTAVKSPSDFFKLQGELMRRNFDSAVAFGSKNTEAFMKLAGDAAAPISTRVSLAVEKVKKAA